MFSDFISWLPLVSIYFLTFIGSWLAISCILRSFTQLTWLECVGGAIALIQLLKIFLMAVSSGFNALGSLYTSLYISFIVILFLSCYILNTKVKLVNELKKSALKIKGILHENFFILIPACLLFLFFSSIILIRAVYFFDNTFDVENYGYTKIAFLYQNNSIFYLSGLEDLRIDASERNGELFFLHSFLLCRDLRLIGLAGVEVWFSILFSIFFLLRQLKVDKTASAIFAIFLSSAPVVFGLSGITKGDSWAILNLTFATAFLVSIIKSPRFSESRFFFFTIFLTLAATSKMTTSFGVAPMFVYGLWVASRKPGRTISFTGFAGLLLCLVVASNKQIQNFFVYNNPLKRQQWESSVGGFKIENFLTSWSDFLPWLFGLQGDLAITGAQNDMTKGMGLVFIILFLGLGGTFLLQRKIYDFKKINFNEVLPLFLVIIIASFCVMTYIPNKMEVFEKHWCRFLAPYFIILACFSFAALARGIKSNSGIQTTLLLIITSAGFYHLAASLKTSTVLSHRGKKDMIQQILNPNPVASRFGLEFGPGPEVVDIYKNYNQKPLRILVYTLDYGSPYSWTFGDNFVWHTVVTDKADLFLELLQGQDFDYFCIAHFKDSKAFEIEKKIVASHPSWEIVSLGDWTNFYRIKNDS